MLPIYLMTSSRLRLSQSWILKRCYSSNDLDQWIAVKKRLVLKDTPGANQLADLYVTLPTRDGSRGASDCPPNVGDILKTGHHLAFFHVRNPETVIRHMYVIHMREAQSQAEIEIRWD